MSNLPLDRDLILARKNSQGPDVECSRSVPITDRVFWCPVVYTVAVDFCTCRAVLWPNDQLYVGTDQYEDQRRVLRSKDRRRRQQCLWEFASFRKEQGFFGMRNTVVVFHVSNVPLGIFRLLGDVGRNDKTLCSCWHVLWLDSCQHREVRHPQT